MLPAQVVAHDRGGRGFALVGAVVFGVHKMLIAKELSLPKFDTGSNAP
jgi:hypothetical protein